jgi:alpha-1,3-glucosyltransferase
MLDESLLQQSAMTRGLVEDFEHSALPTVTPLATVACTFLAMLVGVPAVGMCCQKVFV